VSFDGFPERALDFYEGLLADNTKAYWTDHRQVYEDAVRAPLVALLDELGPEFGEAKVFRPYRDVRFAKDKTPYKTHQGAYVAVGPSTGWYVQVAAPGVRVGAGFYDADSERLAAIREAIADDRRGRQLRRIINRLLKQGWELGGDTLKTAPRGYDAGHPRIDLLRHRSLSVGLAYGFDEEIHTPALLDRVRRDWRAARPLVEWLVTATEHVDHGPPAG
jgi:uncharacterized protein (TIGR02453 family)